MTLRRGLLVVVALLALAPGPAAAASQVEVKALLAQRDAITNWEQFYIANGLVGWQNGTDPCGQPSWTGVTCEEGAVTQLSLQCSSFENGTLCSMFDDSCRAGCRTPMLGTLAPDLASMPALDTLDLKNHNISGSLSPAWGQAGRFPELQGLDLNGNNLTGTLPPTWGQAGGFPQLGALFIEDNQLTGTLPPTWARGEGFQQLQFLGLSRNQLRGALPPTWAQAGGFPQLSLLSLEDNQLTGTLPPIWGQAGGFSQLGRLGLNGNQLTGTLPPTWGQAGGFSQLYSLGLSVNQLTGTLPPSWGQAGGFSQLYSLDLNGNQLTGALPPTWGQAGGFLQLETLLLGNNSLNGPLPPEWGAEGTFQELAELNLAQNVLTGSIPVNWGWENSLFKIRGLALYGNRLCGVVPTGLDNAVDFFESGSGQLPPPPCPSSASSVGAVSWRAQGLQTSGAGANAMCTFNASGGVWCWGQLPDEGGALHAFPTPRPVSSNFSWTSFSVAAGGSICATTSMPGVYCWGSGRYGLFGTDSAANFSATPIALTSLSASNIFGTQYGYTSVIVGPSSACTEVPAANEAEWDQRPPPHLCWGSNTNGSLGNSSTGGVERRPLMVASGELACKLMSIGDGFTCCLDNVFPSDDDGAVNRLDELVTYGWTNWLAYHEYVVVTAFVDPRRLLCWGANNRLQLGTNWPALPTSQPPSNFGYSPVPVEVDMRGVQAHISTLQRSKLGQAVYEQHVWTQLSCGQTACCAASKRLVVYKATYSFDYISDSAYCWGDAFSGPADGQWGPQPVPGAGQYAEVSAPFLVERSVNTTTLMACGLNSLTGYVECWTATSCNATWTMPQRMELLPQVLVLSRTGQGEVGIHIGEDADVSELKGLLQAGDSFLCAQHEETGNLYCLGNNTFGQLGNGATSDIFQPFATEVVRPSTDTRATPLPVPLEALLPPTPPTDTFGSTSGISNRVSVLGIAVGVTTGVLALAAAAAALFVIRRRRRAQALPHGPLTSGNAGGTTPGMPRSSLVTQEGELSKLDYDPLLNFIKALPSEPESSASAAASSSAALASASGSAAASSSAVLTSASSSGDARTAGSGGTRGSSYLADVNLQSWKLPFSELRLQRPIGQGSYGKVYLALLHESEVAVKVLLSVEDVEQHAADALSLSSPLLADLQREGALMAALSHPNVLQLIGVTTRPPAMVTEFCSRGSLSDVLRAARGDTAAAAPLTLHRRLSMALDAAKGMSYLHGHNPPVLHRDLKSPNLLVDQYWQIKVADFNLSRVADSGAFSQMSSLGVTNPRWLSPELLSGAKPSPASDVYAFGIVLVELATFELPWSGCNPWTIADTVRRGGRPDLPPVGGGPGPDPQSFEAVRAEYVALASACHAQDPGSRPAFPEVAAALRALLERALHLHATGGPR